MTAEIWRVSDEVYYSLDASTHVSNSELNVFDSSPRAYERRFITRVDPAPEPSAAMKFGTLFSDIATGRAPEIVEIPRIALASDGSRRGKAWAQFVEDNPGKLLLNAEEVRRIAEMLASLRSHAMAARLFMDAPGEVELAIRWECDKTGLKRRAKLDKLLGNCILDLKTTRDASPKAFASAIYEYRYMRQAVYYQDAVEALTGERMPFAFVVIETEPPYDCAVYDLSPEFEDLGRWSLDRLLARFAECNATGKWDRPEHGQILSLAPPQWAKYETEWSAA